MWTRHLVRRGSAWGLATVVATSVILFSGESAAAQGSADTGSVRIGRGGFGGGAGRGGNRQPGSLSGYGGASPEMFEKFVERVLRGDRVMLNDDQIVKWHAWNKRFDPERRTLSREENDSRRQLRQQLLAGTAPDDARAADILDRLFKLERKWVELHERENRDLATFIKQPMQRLRFYAFQDQLKREFQEMQNRRNGDMNRDGRGGPMRGDSRGDSTMYRQGMRGDSAGGRFPRAGMRPPVKVDTLSTGKPIKN